MINDQHLHELTGGDPVLHRQLLQQFLKTTEQDLNNLKYAVSQKEIASIRHFAHRIKGSAQLLCITPLITMADVLENSSESLLVTTLQARYEQLHDLFNEAKKQIASL